MALDLTDLEALPGAPDENFEALTRAIVARRYGSLGGVRERRQQPGVEFYVRVEHAGELGAVGRVWGWSCKWFRLQNNHELNKSQRDLVEDSLTKALKHVDGLTDFVLCLAERPAKKDLDWFDDLASGNGVTVRVWASEDFEAQLAGFDELRSTFFGELVLTPDKLEQAHERSIAAVSARWAPAVHSYNHVQSRIEQVLLWPDSFNWLNERVGVMEERVESLRRAMANIENASTREVVEVAVDDLSAFIFELKSIVEAGCDGRPTEVRERISELEAPDTSPRRLRRVVQELRKRRFPESLQVTGLGADVRDVLKWRDELETDLKAPMVAIVAAAGMGKTHLAAQITSSLDGPTAGVFIQGSHLRTGGGLDDLARKIPGLRIEHFEDLLESLNSAGERAGARIPLIIDGLNEAERPSEWRSLLDELIPALRQYPHVLVIVTLREALSTRAIPESALISNLEWHQVEVNQIAAAYFSHYLISAAGAWLPMGMFSNPLFLRMYCEAANPLRQDPVGVEALPNSLIGVFELYLKNIIHRLAVDPAHIAIPADLIKRRLHSFSLQMWNLGVRRLSFDEARALLDGGETSWDESVLRRLEEEGVVFREDDGGGNDSEVGFVFDRFAGYVIADVILSRMSYDEVSSRIGETAVWGRIFGEDNEALGEDTGVALVGLLPRRFSGQHVWRSAPDEHKAWAVDQEFSAEAEFLDDDTVDQLALLISGSKLRPARTPNRGRRHPFDRLWELHSSPKHRLNGRFLDRVLRQYSLSERDLQWTEWIRDRAGEFLLSDLETLIVHWSEVTDRTESDDLSAVAIGWLLTSTNGRVRDFAMKALQRYGRPEPRRLFELGASMLDVDDPYIVERVVGAAFGAASAHQMPDPGGPFEISLASWLRVLADHFLAGGSTPTTHELLRSYVRATFEFAGTLHPGSVDDEVDPFSLEFGAPQTSPTFRDEDENAKQVAPTLGIDFENYVIGSAFDDRRNYDYDHAAFRHSRAEVLTRIWDLGWRADRFGVVDEDISRQALRFGGDRARVERYGKKYGWIAYYELIGRLDDAGRSRERSMGGGRLLTPDVDPTFPEEPPVVPISLPEWALPKPLDDETWCRRGEVRVPIELWSPELIHGVPGGWVLVEGFLEHRRDARRVFGFFRTLLLDPDTEAAAFELVEHRKYLGNDFLPSLLELRNVFAAEAPWSPRFHIQSDDDDYAALRDDWCDAGIPVDQIAVELTASDRSSSTALNRSYDIPSFDFAARFNLRQLPGTLDLVDFKGRRASATFRAEGSWQGNLLFVRRDLVAEFAGHRKVIRVAWGERVVNAERVALPAWMSSLYEGYDYVWRDVQRFSSP